LLLRAFAQVAASASFLAAGAFFFNLVWLETTVAGTFFLRRASQLATHSITARNAEALDEHRKLG
jgi:hypothetical protein